MLIKTDGMNSRWMIICCSLFFSFAGQAQQKTNAFDSLVQVIEKRTDYRFYYDRRQTSVLEVDSSYDLQRIELVLKSILNGTGLNFSIDERKRVFISQGPSLLTWK
jgi:hypothetical protein